MASYGFDLNDKRYNESIKESLAKSLKVLVEDMEGEDKFIGLTRGQKPYVQVGEPYRGVFIMNIEILQNNFS